MNILQAGDIVELAMQIEQSGEAFYRAVAKKAETPEIGAFFVDLANEEVKHFMTFGKLAESVKDAPLLSDDEWEQYVKYVEATVQSAFFEGPEKALALAETVTGEKEAIRMAIAFEKETLVFFMDLHEIATGQSQEPIARIIAQERNHIRRLASML